MSRLISKTRHSSVYQGYVTSVVPNTVLKLPFNAILRKSRHWCQWSMLLKLFKKQTVVQNVIFVNYSIAIAMQIHPLNKDNSRHQIKTMSKILVNLHGFYHGFKHGFYLICKVPEQLLCYFVPSHNNQTVALIKNIYWLWHDSYQESLGQ